MPIAFECPACGRGHKALPSARGRTVACLNCGAAITVPGPEPIDPADILLQDDGPTPAPALPAEEPAAPAPEAQEPAPVQRKEPRPSDLAKLPPLRAHTPPLWRRHLHWLLVLALIPLAAACLRKANEQTIADRLEETLDRVDDAERDRVIARLERLGKSDSEDAFFSALPGQRLHGAFLGRSSMAHWLVAAAAAALYLTFFMFLASDGSARPMQVLGVGLFTATVGILLLLAIQVLASFAEGRVMIGRSVVVILFYVFKFIAFSYSAALDPDNGFLLSFVGFTLGVGLCEEMVKTIPLFWHRDSDTGRAWRGLMIWGLASGAGFGIAEGVMYSARYYNGVAGPGMYAVRFLSCVALHAIWSGSVAVLLYQRRDSFDEVSTWYEWVGQMFVIIGVPAVLHGLYDTCVKRDMNGVALLVALASFGYLAFLLSRLQGVDDRAATRALLREYQRRKAAMT